MRNSTTPKFPFSVCVSTRRRAAGCRVFAGALLSLFAVVLASAFLGGCSQPAATSVGTLGAETQRALIGYEDTEYVYPIQVPGSNRVVEMRTRKPLDKAPTYEDYLKWKGN